MLTDTLLSAYLQCSLFIIHTIIFLYSKYKICNVLFWQWASLIVHNMRIYAASVAHKMATGPRSLCHKLMIVLRLNSNWDTNKQIRTHRFYYFLLELICTLMSHWLQMSYIVGCRSFPPMSPALKQDFVPPLLLIKQTFKMSWNSACAKTALRPCGKKMPLMESQMCQKCVSTQLNCNKLSEPMYSSNTYSSSKVLAILSC